MSLPANCPAKNPASAGPTAPGSSEPSPPALAGDSSARAAGAGVKRRQSDRRRPHLDSALSKSSAAIPEQRIPVVSASSIMRSLSSKVSPQPKQPTLRRSVSWHPNVVDHASDLAPRGPTLSRSQRSLESLAPSPPVAPDQTTTTSKPRRSRASADTFTPSRPGASTTAHLSSHQLLYPSPPHSPPIAATTSLSTTPPSSTNPAKARRARKPRSEGASKPKAKSKRRHADSRGDFPTAHLSEALGIYTTVQDSPHHLPNSRPQPHSARPFQRELGSTFPSSSLHSLTESTPASSTIPTTPSSTIHMPKIRRRPSHQRNADPHPTTPNRNLAILWQVDHIHETTSPYAWPLELFSPHKYSRNASMAPVPATVETKAPKMDTKVGCDSNETDEVVACVPTSPVVKCGCMLRIMTDGGRAGGKKKNAK